MNQLRQPESSEGLIVTLNQMGYMLTNPEEYNQAFIEFASTVADPCLEIGAAYGLSTIPALAKGAHIIANDLCEDHLRILKSKVPESDLARLELKPGRFPEDLSFEEESLAGVLSSKMLNFIQPHILQEGIDKIFKWLKKGGKFFVLVSTPYMATFKEYMPVYEKKKQAGELWPGLLDDMKTYVLPQRVDYLPEFINLLDQDDLVKLLQKAGFIIERAGYSAAEDFHPETMKFDGREQAGAIAIKP